MLHWCWTFCNFLDPTFAFLLFWCNICLAHCSFLAYTFFKFSYFISIWFCITLMTYFLNYHIFSLKYEDHKYYITFVFTLGDMICNSQLFSLFIFSFERLQSRRMMQLYWKWCQSTVCLTLNVWLLIAPVKCYELSLLSWQVRKLSQH